MPGIFSEIEPIRYEGPESATPLAFRYYDKDRKVLGKRMEDQLRFAVCWWHSFGWTGSDPFGSATFGRPWMRSSDPMEAARLKAESAFDFFERLGVPFYTFHDRDIAPEGPTPRESRDRLQAMVEVLAGHQRRTGVRLLWGTANLFSHPRYMAGAATNPDPEVFAMAAAQVKEAMDATRELGGQNYVLWGGREGYETLLNTDVKRELEQLGRFLALVVDYKHRSGFKGTILVEPKPAEPSKHQYDFDTATLYAFLQRFGLEKEVRANVEVNHSTLAGHSFEHEIAMALAFGIFGSVDMNRGDLLLGWDTDQFPNSVPEVTLGLYAILQAGGFTTGGLNFDAKLRRQSIDPVDLFHAHVGGMDVCARALLAAERMIQDGRLASARESRYKGWREPFGQEILQGRLDLTALSQRALGRDADVRPVSGRQEWFENLVNRFW
ncbi:MAG: xylose isomerase [Deltaproteobacteria bacterium 13_1_20CM_2_69_21]|nr:MAG: xylose isomerase [Deltaproteobacteria bacterium 13_1_20CM_2_69_21]